MGALPVLDLRPPRADRGALPRHRAGTSRTAKPGVSDKDLLAAIQADLERSPFQGEGHRKVHARLRIIDGIRVSRKRALRVMRENDKATVLL
jgi:hypothetical protein